jgi:hypothetical protein
LTSFTARVALALSLVPFPFSLFAAHQPSRRLLTKVARRSLGEGGRFGWQAGTNPPFTEERNLSPFGPVE